MPLNSLFYTPPYFMFTATAISSEFQIFDSRELERRSYHVVKKISAVLAQSPSAMDGQPDGVRVQNGSRSIARRKLSQ